MTAQSDEAVRRQGDQWGEAGKGVELGTWHVPRELGQYVQPTCLADAQAAPIQDALATITNGATTPRDTAIRILDFVRDDIRFATADVGLRASQVLPIRKGSSLLKGTLTIALFRGAGIPTRYRLIDADERKVRGIVDPVSFALFPLLRRLAPGKTVLHVIPQVFLDDRWLSADPLFDTGFFQGLKRMNVEAVKDVASLEWVLGQARTGHLRQCRRHHRRLDEAPAVLLLRGRLRALRPVHRARPRRQAVTRTRPGRAGEKLPLDADRGWCVPRTPRPHAA